MTFLVALMMLPGLVIGLTVHEFAHAWSASLLGDNFARRQGRVSLNPFRHLSPLGTLAIFLLPIGWGRPVPVNLYNFRNPKRDYLITSLAGPMANVVVAAICIALMYLTRHSFSFGARGAAWMVLGHSLLSMVVIINVILAVLNLVPIPPLDGSKIWPCLIPGMGPAIGRKMTWVFTAVLVALVYTNSLSPVIRFAMDKVHTVMPASDRLVFDGLYENGMKCLDAKQYAQGEEFLTRALAVNPRSGDVLAWRGCARLWQDRSHEALEDMNRAIELDGANATYYKLRANVQTSLGNAAEAQADLAMSRQLDKSGELSTQPASAPGDGIRD